MSDEKVRHLSAATKDEALEVEQPESPEEAEALTPADDTRAEPAQRAEPPLFQFIREARSIEISRRFAREATAIVQGYGKALKHYVVLGLLDTHTFIGEYDLDRIFTALKRENLDRKKDVLLLIYSRGGNIEPAYQISKICKAFAKNRFVVAVPRMAKSAATLIAIGADEIHMGPLGHLGPIDPQLGGLPALGVSQALKSIASVSQQYPGSADMFSRYLNLALTVEQIGYCERIPESAAQYAERLLSTKLGIKASEIANELVHEYKDHGFVIDLDEAKAHLGDGWINTDTPESQFADDLYDLFDTYNTFLSVFHSKRILLTGGLTAGDVLIFEIPKR